MRRFAAILLVLGLIAVSGCGGDGAETGSPVADAGGQRFPDVVRVDATSNGAVFDFTVTISSPYDTPERYADGWRILGPDGTVIAEMTLGHDHATEQPFTRSQTGVEVPDGVTRVTVEGRDRANGYGGGRRTVTLPVR